MIIFLLKFVISLNFKYLISCTLCAADYNALYIFSVTMSHSVTYVYWITSFQFSPFVYLDEWSKRMVSIIRRHRNSQWVIVSLVSVTLLRCRLHCPILHPTISHSLTYVYWITSFDFSPFVFFFILDEWHIRMVDIYRRHRQLEDQLQK